MKNTLTKLIRGYQSFSKNDGFVSPIPLLFKSGCRFYHTCSDYAIEEINKNGALHGSIKSAIRILKCNPLFKGDQEFNN